MVIGKIHVKAALIGVGTAVILGVASVNAAEIDELKAQIEALRERLARLEVSQKPADMKMKSAASAKAVVAGNSPVDRPWVIGHSGEGIRPHAASAT